jgi:transcriptional regulator with XRE-family HTH domain
VRTSLRRLREERGLQQAEAARELDWSASKLVRIENGSVGVSVVDLRALAALYRTPDAEVDELVGLVRATKKRPWWSTANINPAYKKFIGFEADASQMWQYHLSIVPGLLQTDAYMRALIPELRLEPAGQAELNNLAKVRLRRQQEIIHPPDGPEIIMLIDEMALRRPVGGPHVMREQLQHLTKVGHPARLRLAVLPLRAGPHVGMQGGFTIMRFPDEGIGDLLVQENATGNILLQDRPELVQRYHDAFDVMLGKSLQGEQAREFLDQLTEDQ